MEGEYRKIKVSGLGGDYSGNKPFVCYCYIGPVNRFSQNGCKKAANAVAAFYFIIFNKTST